MNNTDIEFGFIDDRGIRIYVASDGRLNRELASIVKVILDENPTLDAAIQQACINYLKSMGGAVLQ